ncbi:hypothetical protein WN51_01643 [Melipona quadrifasciata]|uniref:Uncharacterized protein n=1 Tax=Melipona quadrifasciata TaxID=166423 RepID=A0A0M8ZUF3_9HYME|nr:hypothetical protein WN51_01643 [Melipona quadrifasciata]
MKSAERERQEVLGKTGNKVRARWGEVGTEGESLLLHFRETKAHGRFSTASGGGTFLIRCLKLSTSGGLFGNSTNGKIIRTPVREIRFLSDGGTMF